MPSVSRKQHIAMLMAKAGKSNLGIPQDVGEEFIEADEKQGKFTSKRKKRKRNLTDLVRKR